METWFASFSGSIWMTWGRYFFFFLVIHGSDMYIGGNVGGFSYAMSTVGGYSEYLDFDEISESYLLSPATFLTGGVFAVATTHRYATH